jgi:hypothetical protein
MQLQLNVSKQVFQALAGLGLGKIVAGLTSVAAFIVNKLTKQVLGQATHQMRQLIAVSGIDT